MNADWTAMDTVAGGEFNGDGKGDLIGNWFTSTSPVILPLRNFQLYLGGGKGALAAGVRLGDAAC